MYISSITKLSNCICWNICAARVTFAHGKPGIIPCEKFSCILHVTTSRCTSICRGFTMPEWMRHGTLEMYHTWRYEATRYPLRGRPTYPDDKQGTAFARYAYAIRYQWYRTVSHWSRVIDSRCTYIWYHETRNNYWKASRRIITVMRWHRRICSTNATHLHRGLFLALHNKCPMEISVS